MASASMSMALRSAGCSQRLKTITSTSPPMEADDLTRNMMRSPSGRNLNTSSFIVRLYTPFFSDAEEIMPRKAVWLPSL